MHCILGLNFFLFQPNNPLIYFVVLIAKFAHAKSFPLPSIFQYPLSPEQYRVLISLMFCPYSLIKLFNSQAPQMMTYSCCCTSWRHFRWLICKPLPGTDVADLRTSLSPSKMGHLFAHDIAILTTNLFMVSTLWNLAYNTICIAFNEIWIGFLGEVLSYYLSRLLALDNIPVVILSQVNSSSVQWKGQNISKAEWEEGQIVALIQWKDGLESQRFDLFGQ